MMMHLMSPESWLLVVRQEREHQMRNLARLSMAPDSDSLVHRLRQYWQQLGHRLIAPASPCCAVAPPLAR